MVNEKVNIRQEYLRAARNMCHALFRTGSYYRKVPATLAGGATGDPLVKEAITSLNPLGGTLAHIYQVKNGANRRKDSLQRKELTALQVLYSRFLFYKNFVANTMPIIVPEGKTDSVYLRTAIQHLPAYHPQLGEIVNSKFQAKIRFMKFSNTVTDVMKLGGGSQNLLAFLKQYEGNLRAFKYAPLAWPVIILFDNDDGAKGLFSYANSKKQKHIGFNSTDSFYYMGYNLYLVKTPEGNSDQYTCIEDLFTQELLRTTVNGKTFDMKKKDNNEESYGKHIFAQCVVIPQAAKIDFSGFTKLLDRIIAVLNDHLAKKMAKSLPSPA
ncbi:MAG: hypothetical protein WCI94_14415 [Rhodospirillales bacterium]